MLVIAALCDTVPATYPEDEMVLRVPHNVYLQHGQHNILSTPFSVSLKQLTGADVVILSSGLHRELVARGNYSARDAGALLTAETVETELALVTGTGLHALLQQLAHEALCARAAPAPQLYALHVAHRQADCSVRAASTCTWLVSGSSMCRKLAPLDPRAVYRVLLDRGYARLLGNLPDGAWRHLGHFAHNATHLLRVYLGRHAAEDLVHERLADQGARAKATGATYFYLAFLTAAGLLLQKSADVYRAGVGALPGPAGASDLSD